MDIKERIKQFLQTLTYDELVNDIDAYLPSVIVTYNFDGKEHDYDVSYDSFIDQKVDYTLAEAFAEFVDLENEEEFNKAVEFARKYSSEEESEFDFMLTILNYYGQKFGDSEAYKDYFKETVADYFEDNAREDFKEQQALADEEEWLRNQSYHW
jgi:hypothetical protein